MPDSTLVHNVRRNQVKPDWTLYQAPVPELVIKGTSVLTDAAGNVTARWDKTKLRGMDPQAAHHLPDPKKLTKLSTLVDSEGRVVQQWMSERPEDAAREVAWREFAEELTKPIARIEPIPAPCVGDESLLAVYPIGDHHLGMLSWGRETGANYNLEIGEALLNGAMSYLTNAAAPADGALLIFIGDYLHFCGHIAQTPTHRNPLDADSRYPKMAEVAVRTARAAIDVALARHERVTVIVEPGNHDEDAMPFFGLCLSIAYELEPRVTIDTTPGLFHYHRHGKVLIGTHHGHRVRKFEQLPGIMAADRAADWGETRHRIWLTGHIHTKTAQDFPGCTVESVRTLPPGDAWEVGSGYRSHRAMQALVFHAEHGEVARHTCNPMMLRAA